MEEGKINKERKSWELESLKACLPLESKKGSRTVLSFVATQRSLLLQLAVFVFVLYLKKTNKNDIYLV